VNRGRRVLHIPSSTDAACYAALNARGVDVGISKVPVLSVEKDREAAMLAGFREIGLLWARLPDPLPLIKRLPGYGRRAVHLTHTLGRSAEARRAGASGYGS